VLGLQCIPPCWADFLFEKKLLYTIVEVDESEIYSTGQQAGIHAEYLGYRQAECLLLQKSPIFAPKTFI
jgi:hypothetical protein